MNKSIKKIIALNLCTAAVIGVTAIMPTQIANAKTVTNQERQVFLQDLKPNVTSVKYSDMVSGDGAVHLKVNLPQGVKLTTTDPYKFSDALTQNYDISISEGVHYSKDYFIINVNWANSGIKYLGDWVINVDGSMFTDGKARKLNIEVNNNLFVGTPKITTNVDKGVTVNQLKNGFDLEMNLQNAEFNTVCFGNYIRLSMIKSSGLDIYPVAYCDSLGRTRVKMRVQAMNGVESWRTHFEFKIEGEATNSPVPITVRIPIIR
ncbi:MAG: hypothetical protein ACRC28_01615 [Clostridium sp.]|uniref:hypothetical protein n=1 Tax=Clostridium sp. TaxID=1506 RepID=UPI003F308E5E